MKRSIRAVPPYFTQYHPPKRQNQYPHRSAGIQARANASVLDSYSVTIHVFSARPRVGCVINLVLRSLSGEDRVRSKNKITLVYGIGFLPPFP